MFLKYYNLRQQPFGVTPDSRFLFLSNSHREALASLFYGVEENRGFVTLIAPPGMGKTTLLFRFMEHLRDTTSTAFLFQTQCNSRDFLRYLLADMKIECSRDDVVEMHEKLNYALLRIKQAGSQFVLIIDEAQNLDDSVLETVRLLSDFETSTTKLMQIILVGQPQLAEKLASPKLTQLRQRISIWAKLTPFTAEETSSYIDHRLAVAGSSDRSLFTRDARQLIASISRGIPRNINAICFNALSVSCATGQKRVDAAAVREVASDLALPELQSAAFAPTAAPVRNVARAETPRVKAPGTRPSTLQWTFLAALGIGAGLLWSPIVRSSSDWMTRGAIAATKNVDQRRDRSPGTIRATLQAPEKSRALKVVSGTQIPARNVVPASKTLSSESSLPESPRVRSKDEIAVNDFPRSIGGNPEVTPAQRHEMRSAREWESPKLESKGASIAKGDKVSASIQRQSRERARSKQTGTAVATEKGGIVFITDPPGLDVVIDAMAYGPSPVRAVLPAGVHTYLVEASKATKPMSGEFDLPPSTVRIETVRLEYASPSTATPGPSQAVEKPPHDLH